ncbi:TetR/AcrR family transcriptional regulator [Streptomyces spongiae]|uniref:TetR/AcrR family transcriptional regulator n=1 Tax=Streptomyces spongiae TaxID=565072 RepID=A0A5N8X9Y9_9ACTN|nr:TetR family transcriptional regulator C-terminal domain-containing protein [Streptomyces spongiae]MPY56197.1 TetR/AcrR family transcriptional regulator [Streptomyces spongiae]
MPIEVDEARRLDEIAVATIQVARERGVRAATIRAVAQRLGGSTAMVTNYVPSRADLMINALRHAEDLWKQELEDEVLDGLDGMERLTALIRWMCTTTQDDEVLRRLLMEILSEGPKAGAAVERVRSAMARSNHEEMRLMVANAGLRDTELAADVLHLLVRGCWLSMLESPQDWSTDRSTRAALAVLELLRGPEGETPASS